MPVRLLLLMLLINVGVMAQKTGSLSLPDPGSLNVVLEHPDMKNVSVKQDIPYLLLGNNNLTLDIYSPHTLKKNDKRAAVIFLNGAGDAPGQSKIKNFEGVKSWARLVAAQGYIAITMESDREHIQESIHGVFNFLNERSAEYCIDKNKLGIYAASANITQSLIYLMSEDAYTGIKAAVLYYGGPPQGPFRKDLPVLFVVAEGDVVGSNYNMVWSEVLKNKAPWTIKMASTMPHAFDMLSDNDQARQIIKQTISFWKDHLESIPAPSWPHSEGRDLLARLGIQDSAAIDLLKKWTEKNPGDARALSRYGEIVRTNGQYEEAEHVYKKLYKLTPQDVMVVFDLVTALSRQKKFGEAETTLIQAINSGIKSGRLYAQLGQIQFAEGKIKEGVVSYEQALEIGMSPGKYSQGLTYYNLACGYAKLNNRDKALDALKKALAQGFGSKEQFETDEDLSILKSDSGFQDFINGIK